MNTESKIYQAYYTKSDHIISYMVKLLELEGTEKILEPCAGDGVFIDFIIKHYPNIRIDAFELNSTSFINLLSKYTNRDNIKVKQTDTLIDTDLQFISTMGGGYDAIIANPPYGAWRNKDERKKLKKSYNGFYAKESYTLFLYRSIEALKEKGKLSFIIPDTYLNLHMHKDIRKYLLTNTKIKEVSLFPSSFFPGVNFGYANLSIISLEKCSNQNSCLNNNFKIIKGYRSVNELGMHHKHLSEILTNQREIFENPDHAFITNGNAKVIKCINNKSLSIGDTCDCVTGFYSGNDKKYLKVLNKNIRNSKKYELVNTDLVEYNCNSLIIDGIKGSKKYVPIVKGGNKKYYKPDEWFMYWTTDIVGFYKKDKKARYQNSKFYFKKGIGVPMVSSSTITGALIENRLFDQSIVGIFPKDEVLIYYLLAFFNSPTCNTLIRTINPSTNNSANYIKKLPLLLPDDEKIEIINKNISLIIQRLKTGENNYIEQEIENNKIIKSIYGF